MRNKIELKKRSKRSKRFKKLKKLKRLKSLKRLKIKNEGFFGFGRYS
jgi:hypothetical protein